MPAQGSGENSGPVVRICIPTYERPAWLARLIDTIAAQTWPRWRISISDNSRSEDAEIAIRPRLCERIEYWRNEENLGLGLSTLRLLERVQEPFFTFTPDDDYWESANLERKIKFLESHPDCVAVFSNAHRVSREGERLSRFRTAEERGDSVVSSEELIPAIGIERRRFINILTAVMRTDVLLEPFRESWRFGTEEYFMWWLGLRGVPIGFISEPLVSLTEAEHYRVVRKGGQAVDLGCDGRRRQLQLVEIWEALDRNRPEVGERLRSQDVREFLWKAVGGSSGGIADAVRGAALGFGHDGLRAAAWALEAGVEKRLRALGRRAFGLGRQGSALGPLEEYSRGV